jgi:hypothetical protein
MKLMLLFSCLLVASAAEILKNDREKPGSKKMRIDQVIQESTTSVGTPLRSSSKLRKQQQHLGARFTAVAQSHWHSLQTLQARQEVQTHVQTQQHQHQHELQALQAAQTQRHQQTAVHAMMMNKTFAFRHQQTALHAAMMNKTFADPADPNADPTLTDMNTTFAFRQQQTAVHAMMTNKTFAL